MIKFLNGLKKYSAIGSLALLAFLALGGGFAHAAADTTLTGAIASSTSFISDNLAVMVTFIIEMVLKFAGVALAFGALYWAYRKIRSIFRKN